MSGEDFSRFADDEGHPVAKEGLRAIREERAPESSVKATLDALRRDAPRSSGVRTFLLWALGGAVVAAIAAYFLFFA
jgi:hypothetical protein